jgi:hypothetical protein
MENKAEFYLQAMKDLERADNEIKELFIQMQGKDFGYDFLLAIGIAEKLRFNVWV